MKKPIALFLLLILMNAPLLQADATDGRTKQGPFARPFMVFSRGLVNLVGLPFEISSTFVRETRIHSRLWPVSYVPRLLTNIFIRGASAATDILISPFVVPFTDDLTPLTKPMGLPEYPWRIEEA